MNSSTILLHLALLRLLSAFLLFITKTLRFLVLQTGSLKGLACREVVYRYDGIRVRCLINKETKNGSEIARKIRLGQRCWLPDC